MADNLLELGLIGLARTPSEFPGMWFHGHHGATVLAAHFICVSGWVEPEVRDAVHAFAQRTMAATPALFEAADVPSPRADGQRIVDKLNEVIVNLTADGHDVIFASLALRALRARPDLATEAVVGGVLQLLADAQRDTPQRYLGFDDYLRDPIDYSSVEAFPSVQAAARHALGLHARVHPDQVINGQTYFLAGNKLHDITHAHALVELDEMGFSDLARRGLDPLRKQFYLCEHSRVPEDVEPFESPAPLDPWSVAFWERDASDAHQVKLAYSVMSLLANTPAAQRYEILAPISKYWHLLP